VTLIDSNIPMYLVGGEHPLRAEARRLVEASLRDGERLVTDAEVLQEILHRYVAIRRRDFVQPAFDALLGVVDEVLPVEGADVGRAKEIVLGKPKLSARDAIHLAIMERGGIRKIMSFDTGFDGYPGITRVGS
jgi:predicted nucleic acid-binding protein